jgi:hypothetical protein
MVWLRYAVEDAFGKDVERGMIVGPQQGAPVV